MFNGWLEVLSISDGAIRELIILAGTLPGRLEVLGVQPHQATMTADPQGTVSTSYNLRIWWSDLDALAALQRTLLQSQDHLQSSSLIH